MNLRIFSFLRTVTTPTYYVSCCNEVFLSVVPKRILKAVMLTWLGFSILTLVYRCYWASLGGRGIFRSAFASLSLRAGVEDLPI